MTSLLARAHDLRLVHIMQLKFCGAAGTTTGSQHLLEVNGKRILLDCGLYQGRRQEAYKINCEFPHFDPATIDAVVLSHAHIDHSGNLPNLCAKGFDGNIFATFATRDLCQIMLADSAHIQMYDVQWLNKHNKRKNLPLVEPLYTERDAEQCLKQFVNVGYDRPMLIAPGVTLRFFDAGHILGSAQVLLEIEDEEDGKTKRFLFSGDVGRGDNDILNDPEIVKDVDYLLMESTYGGREHEHGASADDRICDAINDAIKRGGKIIIPCFAVERTQQILYVIHQLFIDNRIPKIPVYVDSPLAVNATEIFRLHPECFNKETNSLLITEFPKSPSMSIARWPSMPRKFSVFTRNALTRRSMISSTKKATRLALKISNSSAPSKNPKSLTRAVSNPSLSQPQACVRQDVSSIT